MYAHECPKCGAFLDPGERCDCTERRAEEEQRFIDFKKELSKHIEEGKHGQLRLAI